MKLRDLDLGWLTVIAVGMFAHINNICIVGFCGDPAIASFQADLPFILFILSVLTFVADHSWYPVTLKKPHNCIQLFIDVIIALTISNIALKMIWLPYQDLLMSSSTWLSNWIQAQKLHSDGSLSISDQTAWGVYFSNILEQHAAHAVPTPMLRFATEDTDVNKVLLQWSDDTLPYTISVALSVIILGTRFFVPGFWDRLRSGFMSVQMALRRRRGRILLLPGGSLARLRSLAPRYVLSKLDDSEDEVETRTVDPATDHSNSRASTAASASAAASVAASAAASTEATHLDLQQQRRLPASLAHALAHASAHVPVPPPPPPYASAPPKLSFAASSTTGAHATPAVPPVATAAL